MGIFDNLCEIEKADSLESSYEQLKSYIIDWVCKEFNLDDIYKKLRICVDMSTTPPTVNYDGDLYADNDITSLCDNGVFQWGEVKGKFSCAFCKSLLSLKGAPKKVGGKFSCAFCKSLLSLKGAPKKVGGGFYCGNCESLNTLEGSPKEVGGDFDCGFCNLLKTLEGAPKKVGGDFICSYCKSLISLKGSPKEVGGDFYCGNCDSLTSLGEPSKEVGMVRLKKLMGDVVS